MCVAAMQHLQDAHAHCLSHFPTVRAVSSLLRTLKLPYRPVQPPTVLFRVQADAAAKALLHGAAFYVQFRG